MKLTKPQLNTIFSLARQNFVDLDRGDLDMQEFTAVCWLKAIETYFNTRLNRE